VTQRVRAIGRFRFNAKAQRCRGAERFGCFTHAVQARPVGGPMDLMRIPLSLHPHRSSLRSAKTSNAKGVPSSSPALPRSGYAGNTQSKLLSTPTGLRPQFGRGAGGTPLGFDGIGDVAPRVDAPASRQPWAGRRNAVGVRRELSLARRPSAEQGAPPNSAQRFPLDELLDFGSPVCAPSTSSGRVRALIRWPKRRRE